MGKDKNITRTSINQPRELWDKVRGDAIREHKTNDQILTSILKIHYGVEK